MKKTVLIILVGGLIFGCGKEKKKPAVGTNEPVSVLMKAAPVAHLSLAYRLMLDQCLSCHKAGDETQERFAPPMQEIQLAYLEKYNNEEDFTNAIVSFLEEPTEKKSIIPGAIERYHIMPKLGYSEASIREICEFLYKNSLEDE